MTHPFCLPELMQNDLKKVVRASTSFIRQVFRARIILLAAEGKSHSFICQELKTTHTTVRKWINRFNQNPFLETLEDAPRSGCPHTISSEAKCEVIKFACSDIRTQAPDAGNIWTIKSLRACVKRSTGIEISKSEISRILNHEDLRPHKVKMWLHSPDVFFKEKVNRISSLYLNPPRDAVILCIDEKTGMQALERKRSVSPRQGSTVRLDSEYKRHGTQTLIASFEVKTGKVFGVCGKTRKKEDLIDFMEKIADRYPTQQVFIIWDNLNTHHGSLWDEYNAKHGNRFHFVYTPVHGSWVNQIEVWFGILQRKTLKNGSFTSEEELRKAVLGFIETWNQKEGHPFRWQFRGYIEKAA